MKTLIFYIFCCFSTWLFDTPNADALTNLPDLTPDTLYVHAPSGLVLRETPSKNGNKIATVPRDGQPLKVLEHSDPSNRFTAEKIGTFELSGGWVKVQTAEGQDGWLFEGYLSRYRPMLEKAPDTYETGEWFYRIISPVKGERAIYSEVECTAGYKQSFQDGTYYENLHHSEGMYERFRLPSGKMTMQEALVLFRPLWFGSSKTSGRYDAIKKRLSIRDLNNRNLVIECEAPDQLNIHFSTP